MRRVFVDIPIVFTLLSMSAVQGQGHLHENTDKANKTVITQLYVDPVLGNDTHDGSRDRPCQTLGATIALIPEEVTENITIHLKAATYATTGGKGMPANYLILRRKMWPGITVHLKGETNASAGDTAHRPILDWGGREFLILVLEGQWSLTNLQVGTRRPDQRQGIGVEGPGLANVRDVRMRIASLAGEGLLARRAGRIHLFGAIELNEDLHDKRIGEENFCGILATDHGTVQYQQTKGASLSLGNGRLGASYYGCVRLGCESARITSWTTSNNISIACSGRVDLHGTRTHLRGHHPENSLIGPEDDGHILAENTHVILESLGCRNALYLQKASKVFGGPFEIQGKFDHTIVAMSGSVFGGTVKGAVSNVEAHTGGQIFLEHGSNMPKTARGALGGMVVLPDDKILR